MLALEGYARDADARSAEALRDVLDDRRGGDVERFAVLVADGNGAPGAAAALAGTRLPLGCAFSATSREDLGPALETILRGRDVVAG